MERSLIILKPDAVQRMLVGEIIARFERRGLKIIGLKLLHVAAERAHEHYAVHKGKAFYDSLIEYITSGPVVVMAVEGPEAIAVVRASVGATTPLESPTGSIRGDYGLEVGRNLIHASDGPTTARAELRLWFNEDELCEYDRDIDRWILE
ncbi:MAG: nucleoside-diphosphate kinase [Anaerolineae bacterium]